MSTNEELLYKEYIVAFVDMLGFSDYVKKAKDDKELFARILWALKQSKKYISIEERFNSFESHFKKQLFSLTLSDSIVLLKEREKFDFVHVQSIISTIATLNIELIQKGIFFRGSIVTGNMYVHSDKDIFLGPAFLEACKNEKEIAIYPRILIDKTFISCKDTYEKGQITKNDDGLYSIDCLGYQICLADRISKFLLNKIDTDDLNPLGERDYNEGHIEEIKWCIKNPKISPRETRENYLLLKESMDGIYKALVEIKREIECPKISETDIKIRAKWIWLYNDMKRSLKKVIVKRKLKYIIDLLHKINPDESLKYEFFKKF